MCGACFIGPFPKINYASICDLAFLCLRACVCGVCERAPEMCAPEHAQEKTEDARRLPLPLFVLRQGLSPNFELSISARLTGQQAPRIHLPILLNAGATGMPDHDLLFHMVVET